ncbi:DNA repair protein RecN [Alistipes dispar]|uniref:DNA repair protein RecN n=1 Tax=Alistipes dispar TaxID=2585119 RepID=UPI00266B4F98|nr:DNA repair protein RecN [Alistipes dispar]
MLRRLSVENYALIDKLELELDPHLNIITGETGAGKSILLGALGLLLGSKNDGSAMKDAARSCTVEGTFALAGPELEEFFAENDLEYAAETTLTRIITPAGKSRAFVNDVPVSLAQLREVGTRLLDIHSQHQNLILSSEEFRTSALDTVAGNGELLREYATQYARLQELRRETAALREAAEQGRRDEEWLRFQTEELTAANLRAGEQAEIEEELAMLENADRIGEAFTTLRNALDADETGVLVQLKNSETSLAHIGEHYPAAAEYAARLRSTLEELKDIGASAAADSERIDADPERLAKLSARLDTLLALQQKHHAADEAELIGLRDRCTARLAAIVHGDERIAEAEAALQKAAEKARKLADRLRKAREKAAPAFAGHIRGTLARLGMPDTVFEAAIDDLGELTRTGGDSVRFLFSANHGRAPQSVERIASGGELSRVMLALKALLAERMQLPTIIFDEIDTGVSGRIADAMGEIIASLAASMQVVDITHLPQVASKGAAHFVVYKRDGRTSITRLSDDERITEIAKMLSGSEITDAAIAQARILLGRNGEPRPAAPGCSDTPAPGSLF